MPALVNLGQRKADKPSPTNKAKKQGGTPKQSGTTQQGGTAKQGGTTKQVDTPAKEEDDLASGLIHELQHSKTCRQFTIADVRAATKDFSDSQVLGTGNYAAVYRGVTDSGEAFAMKRLKKVSEPGSASFEALKQEVKTLGALSHNNIVRLHGYCFAKDEQILVYELAEGGTLEDVMKGPDGKGCQLFLKQRVKIALQVAEALQYLHSMGVIHRDIKPANVLISQSMDAKVADFGLLKVLDPQNEYTVTMLAGTFGYMDPLAMRSGRTNFSTDVFALGITILGLITGRGPAVIDEQDLGIIAQREEQLRHQQQQQKRERDRRRLEKERKQKAREGGQDSPEKESQPQEEENTSCPKDLLRREMEAAARLLNEDEDDEDDSAFMQLSRHVVVKPTIMPLRKWTAQMQRFGEVRSMCEPFLRPLIDMDDCPLALIHGSNEDSNPGSRGSTRAKRQKRKDIKAISDCIELALKCTDDDGRMRYSIVQATAKLRRILESIPSVDGPQFSILDTDDIKALLGDSDGVMLVTDNNDFSPELVVGRDPWTGEHVVVERSPMPASYLEHAKEDPALSLMEHLRRASDFRHTSLLQLLGACTTVNGAFLVYRMPKDHIILDTKLFGTSDAEGHLTPRDAHAHEDGGRSLAKEPSPSGRPPKPKTPKQSIILEEESTADAIAPTPSKAVASRFSHELSLLHLSRRWQEKASSPGMAADSSGSFNVTSSMGPLSLRRRISAALGVAIALQFLHERGQVHGNVHVGRVMTSSSGECILIGMGSMCFLPVESGSSNRNSESKSDRTSSREAEADEPLTSREGEQSGAATREDKPDLHVSMPSLSAQSSDSHSMVSRAEDEAEGDHLLQTKQPVLLLARSLGHTPRQQAFLRFGAAPPLELESLTSEQLKAMEEEQMGDIIQFGSLVLSIASDRGPIVDGPGDLALTNLDPLPDSMTLKDWIVNLLDSRHVRPLLESCSTPPAKYSAASQSLPKQANQKDSKGKPRADEKPPKGSKSKAPLPAGEDSAGSTQEASAGEGTQGDSLEWRILESFLNLGLQCLREDAAARPLASELVSRLRAMVASLDAIKGKPGTRTSRLNGFLVRQQAARRDSLP